MAQSPLHDKIDLVTHKVIANGKELSWAYQVVSIDIQNSIDRISTAQIALALEFEGGDNKTFEKIENKNLAPGADFEILLGYHSDERSLFKGIIVNIGIKAYEDTTLFIVNCSDKAVKMTLGRKNKFFKNQKDSTIISSIISDNGFSSSIDTTSYKFKQVIQYYASDWDFIRLRAEANGLLVYTESGKVCAKKPDLSNSPKLELTYGKDVYTFVGQVEARYQIPTVKAHSWDMSGQKLVQAHSSEPKINPHGNLTGKKLAEVLGIKEYELRSTCPLEQSNLKNWVDGHLLKSRLSRIRGEVETIGTALAKLNTTVKLKGFGARMNGNALITKVHHQVKEGTWTTTLGFGLAPEYFANRPQVQSPAAAGLLPAIHGLQNGTVKKIDSDPDGEVRILVDVPIIEAGGEGIWARLSNFYSTKNKGAFFIPEIDDEVVVGFLNNDPRFPIILGSMYSSKISTPYKPDKDNHIKAIVTKHDLKLEFDEKEKKISIETPGKNKVILSDKDKSILLQDEHGNKIEMNSSGITIKSPKEINIQATSNIKIKSNANITAKTSVGDVSIEGKNVTATAKMNFTAKGNMNSTFEAGLNCTVKSGLNTTIKGLMVMIN